MSAPAAIHGSAASGELIILSNFENLAPWVNQTVLIARLLGCAEYLTNDVTAPSEEEAEHSHIRDSICLADSIIFDTIDIHIYVMMRVAGYTIDFSARNATRTIMAVRDALVELNNVVEGCQSEEVLLYMIFEYECDPSNQYTYFDYFEARSWILDMLEIRQQVNPDNHVQSVLDSADAELSEVDDHESLPNSY